MEDSHYYELLRTPRDTQVKTPPACAMKGLTLEVNNSMITSTEVVACLITNIKTVQVDVYSKDISRECSCTSCNTVD